MGEPVTIVMYHYVRDLARSRYPEIKGLSLEEFSQQVGYIKKHYNVVGGEELIDAILGGVPLPPRPLILTFDDGYADHYANVFPVLEREGIAGCFFPSLKCILEHEVLDVNKVHFVLASTSRKEELVDYICSRIDESRDRYGLPASSEYREKQFEASRYDPAEVMFCKRVLQRELPLELRREIADELFRKYVSSDEASFSRQLYMSPDQIRDLREGGMFVGSHGYDHFFLNTLTREEQEAEVDRSLEFLRSIGVDDRRWIFCYPYGAYDDSLLAVLKSRHCVAGLSTEVALASLDRDNPLALPRIDTNDLPKDECAPANEWTLRVASPR